MEETRALKASCLCGKCSFSHAISTSTTPRPLGICHCNTCRHSFGTLCCTAQDWPSSIPPEHALPLSTFPVSTNVDVYFCKECGSQLFWHRHTGNYIKVMAGALDDPEMNMKLESQIFIEDTKDGGLSTWLPSVPGGEQRQGNQTLVAPVAGERHEPSVKQKPESLEAYCQCKGVHFRISRPDESSHRMQRPLPDLLKPYSTEGSSEVTEKGYSGKSAWWLGSRDRYTAGNCACTSCRKASGVYAVQWAFIPRNKFTLMDGSPFNLPFGTLKEHRSSPGRARYFCERCGAMAFWTEKGQFPVIDVAVGLLNAESGARAEEWLDWCTDRVSFEEDAPNNAFVDALKDGLLAWGVSREHGG